MGVFGMKNWIKTAGLYALVCAAALLSAMALSRVGSAVAVFSRETGTTVVVDAGHGGEDGGTLSCTGVRESGLNLEIALRVNDLFALLGQRTRMLRTQDVSLHDTEAATIAARKASDIRARVRLTEETPKAVLLSIHQNHFPESKYRGAQVFYAAADGSRALAERLQAALGTQLDPDNHRSCKKAGGDLPSEACELPRRARGVRFPVQPGGGGPAAHAGISEEACGSPVLRHAGISGGTL